MLNGLDLFSGIGGISASLSEWVRPVAYCEIDPYCQGVLLSRMADGSLPNAPIWCDVATLSGKSIDADIIYGGFPCQDISIAGSGKGLEGKRSGLFFEIIRLAKEIQPSFIFLENVPAITTRGGLRVVRAIAEMGYDCRWCVISAASVGALQRRERWFLLAHSHSQPGGQAHSSAEPDTAKQDARRGFTGRCWAFKSVGDWQKIVSEMDRSSDGIPCCLDRIRALGNAVVPEQAKEAFKILIGLTKGK